MKATHKRAPMSACKLMFKGLKTSHLLQKYYYLLYIYWCYFIYIRYQDTMHLIFYPASLMFMENGCCLKENEMAAIIYGSRSDRRFRNFGDQKSVAGLFWATKITTGLLILWPKVVKRPVGKDIFSYN